MQTRYENKPLALDCEMVADFIGNRMLARVSIVDENLVTIYDTHVKPLRNVADYLTQFSGIRQGDLDNAPPFHFVRNIVQNMLSGCLLIGHSIHHDLRALQLSHSSKMTVDIKDFPRFRRDSGGRTPGLRLLAQRYLNEYIQQGSHDSIEDARTVMKLYLRFIKNSVN